MPGWNFALFPDSASNHATQVDYVYFFMVVLCTFMTVAIAIAVIYFAVKYRARPGQRPTQIHGNNLLEITWSAIPLAVFMLMFVWGAVVFFDAARPPKDADVIYVVGKQWMWKIQHADGAREINELHVPANRDIMLRMVSQDVIHSFYIPAFRIKADVLPGRYTSMWFHATKAGDYHLFCAEYCGTMHSGMIGHVVVMEPGQYQVWLSGGAAQGSMASNGERLFQDLGCISCHRGDSQARAPNLAGVYNSVVHLADGRTVVADDAYIRESVLNPTAKVVAGFAPIMPSFQGQVDEEGILALISYIKSLATAQTGGPVANRPAPANAPPAGTKVE